MKRKSKFLLLVLLILLVSFTLSACSEDGIDYANIDTITVDEASIADGFLLSEFDITKIILNIKYLDTKDAKGNVVKGEVVPLPASLDMVIAEDKAQLSVPGTKTITLRYGKYDIAFVLKLYDDAVKKFKVVFLNEELTPLGDTQYIIEGGKAVQPTVPKKSGFDFLGWIDRETNELSSFDNITKNTTFTAYYAAVAFDVTYHTKVVKNVGAADGSIGGGNTTPNEVITKLTTVKVPRGGNALNYAPQIPVVEGHSNGRWENTDAMANIGSDRNKTAYDFYAVYDQDSVVITFRYKKYDATDVDEPKNYYVNSKIEDNFAVEQQGYKFVGWFTESGKEITFPYTVTNEMRFEAKYIKVSIGNSEYKLTVKKPYDWETNWKAYYRKDVEAYEIITDDSCPDWEANTFYAYYGLSYELIEHYNITTTAPIDWNANWKNYYTKEGDNYNKVIDEIRPIWTAGTYYYYDAEYRIIGYNGNENVIVIPDKYNGIDVKGISLGVFSEHGIKEFVVSATNKYFKVDSGVLYNFNKDRLLAYPTLKTDTSFNVERGTSKVYSIAAYAFKNAKYLTSVNLGYNLINIEEEAFANCTKLTSITIPASVEKIWAGAFKMDKSSALTSITFNTPSKLTEIDNEAFYGLNRLVSIDIPASVIKIGSGVFALCKSLESIRVAENNQKFKISDGITLDPSGKVYSAGGLYSEDYTTLYCFPANYTSTDSTDIVLPSSLTTIKTGAFSYTKLQGILITSNSITLENDSVVSPNLVYLRVNSGSFVYDSPYGGYVPKHILVNDDEGWEELEDFKNNYIYEYVTVTVVENGRDVQKTTITILGGRKTNNDMVIPSAIGEINVTKIASRAFASDGNIVSITLPNAVEEIGESAFEGIPNLTIVYLNDNLTIIGKRAFANCEKLTRVEFSALVTITAIGREAFLETPWYKNEDKEYLTINSLLLKFNGYDISAEIKDGITYIASDAFSKKTNLTSVTFKSTKLVTIGYRAFEDCRGLSQVILPGSIKNIEEEAFYGCNNLLLAVINAPKSASAGINIAANAFPNNESLRTSIRYTEGDTSYTLYYQIDEAESIPDIGTIFVNSLKVDDNANRKFAGWYYDKEFKNLVTFPLTLTDYNTTETAGIKSMRIYAKFIAASEGSIGLEYELNDTGGYTVKRYTGSDNYVIIPQKYKNKSINAIKDGAFNNNTTIISINFPYARNASTGIIYTFINSVGENAFDNTLWYQNYRGDFVIINDMLIKYKGNAKIVEVPPSITKIADGAFRGNTDIEKVVIPEGVTSLGKNMFRDCSKLTTVILPSTLTSIGDNVFDSCENLTSINFKEALDLVEISSSALNNTAWLNNQLDDCIIINDILYKYQGKGGEGSLGKLTIMNGIIQIADRAFENNNSLRMIYLPKSVKYIGDYAFYGSSKLNEVVIFSGGSDLMGIGEYAFASCINLSKINLSVCSALYAIGAYAFSNISALASIIIPANVSELGEGAFKNSDIVNVSFASGSKLRAIPKDAFSNCSSLSWVIFNGASALTQIGENAFYECGSLKSFANPNASIETIGNYAFLNCVYLSDLDIDSSKLKNIGISAFKGMGYVNSFNDNMVVMGNILIKYRGSDAVVDIPYTITTIYDNAFSGNTSIRTINFASKSRLTSINDNAFKNCTNLENINFPSTITSVGDDIVTNTLWYQNIIREGREFITIGNTLIKYNGNSKQVIIPEKVTVINKNAFKDVELYDIQIGSQVTLIKKGAFDGIITPKITYVKGRYIYTKCNNADEFSVQKSNSINNYNNVNLFYLDDENYISTGVFVQGITDYYIFDDDIMTYVKGSYIAVQCQDSIEFDEEKNNSLTNYGNSTLFYKIDGNYISTGIFVQGITEYYIFNSDISIPPKGKYINVQCLNAQQFAAQKTNSIQNYYHHTLYYVVGGNYVMTNAFIDGTLSYYIYDEAIRRTDEGSWSLTLLNPKPFEMEENTVNEIFLASDEAKEDYTLDIRWDEYVSYFKVLKKYAITLSYDPERGSSTQSIVNLSMIYEEISLIVAEGYVFVGWYVDEDHLIEGIKYPLKLNHSFTIYAKFVSYENGTGTSFSTDDTNTQIERYNDTYDKTIVIPRERSGFEFTSITGRFKAANPPFTYGTHIWNADLQQFVPESDEEIATHYYEGAFEGHTEIETIYFATNSKITIIGKNAFKNCTSLRTIVFPTGLILIEEGAFAGCTSLVEIVFAEGQSVAITIEANAFANCTSLKSITFPVNISVLSDGAFSGCTSLVNVYMSDTDASTVDNISGYPFSYNDGKLKIYVNTSVYNIYLTRWSGYVSNIVEVIDEK